MKPLAYKTKFIDPYKNENGSLKTNLPHLREKKAQAGVYLIKSKRTGKIIYIGFSSTQLYKTIYRHFQSWNDKQQQRFVYAKTGYTIRIILTTPGRAAVLEKYLITKYSPRDNKNKKELYLTSAEENKADDILNNTEFIYNNEECPF